MPDRPAGMARAAAVLALALLAACGGSSSTAVSDAAVGGDAAADGGVAADAGGDACNGLDQLGAIVTAACEPGAPSPATRGTGGTIADGTYVLTESQFFGICSTSELGETLVVSQGTVQSLATGASGVVTRKSLTYTVTSDGAMLVETQTCPANVVGTVGFSATPTRLTIYLVNALGTRVSTFTRQ